MKHTMLKVALRLSKSPDKVYSAISKLVSIVLPENLVLIEPVKVYDEIEKKLLLSSFSLNYSTQKDMRSDFLYQYIEIMADDVCSKYSGENLIYLFENACIGMSFGQGGTEREREIEAKNELRSHIRNRLLNYRAFIEEYVLGNLDNLEIFYELISDKPLNSACWHFIPFINYIRNDVKYDGINEDGFIKFKKVIQRLHKSYYNIVTIPHNTWMNDNPKSERFHTERLLGSISIPISFHYLTFHTINGAGSLKCRHCSFTTEIVAFTHGVTSACIGRQCPQCGEFCIEHNESKDYHQFSTPTEDFVCPKCNYIIRSRQESIFKGNENPLFCPRCHSIDLNYQSHYKT